MDKNVNSREQFSLWIEMKNLGTQEKRISIDLEKISAIQGKKTTTTTDTERSFTNPITVSTGTLRGGGQAEGGD